MMVLLGIYDDRESAPQPFLAERIRDRGLVPNVQLSHRAPPSPYFAGKARDGETGLASHIPLQLLHLRLDHQVNRFMGCDCHIEGYHKSLKQNVSWAKSPPQTVTTQTHHFFAALCDFLKLERLKMATTLKHFALKSKLSLNALRSAFATLRTLTPAQGSA